MISAEYSIFELERIKREIDILSKTHHIEILKILKKYQEVKLNENKSGVYVNLTFLPKEVVDSIQEYLTHINSQEEMLEMAEKEKGFYKTQIESATEEPTIDENMFEKGDKDNSINRYSYIC